MKFYTLVLMLLIDLSNSYCQTLTGNVFDENKNPLIGASVYLDGTTIGTRTDKKGFYSLSLNNRINSTLVISFLGYQTQIIEDPYEKPDNKIFMVPKIIQLSEVKVMREPLTREQKLKIFREQFLGRTRAGRSCKIENEDDIILKYDFESNSILASANKPIIINNPYLGYSINYNLIDGYINFFQKNFKNKNAIKVFFAGTTLFKESGKINKTILKRRENTYLGSKWHFFKNLSTNYWEKDGFLLLRAGVEVNPDSFFRISDTLGLKKITLLKNMSKNESEPFVSTFNIIYKNKYSEVFFRTRTFIVDEFGNISFDTIQFNGDIGKKRVGDLLPMDFSLSQDTISKMGQVEGPVSKYIQLNPVIRDEKDLRALAPLISTAPSFNQDPNTVSGRLSDSKTNSPVCYADISLNDKTTFTKSNSKGEFQLVSAKFPAALKIQKIGYQDTTILINSPKDPILISLIPLDIHYKPDYRIKIQYASFLKTAVKKLRKNVDSGLPDHSAKKLVYCRITTMDNSAGSLFECYAQMNVSGNSVQGYQSDVARFAAPGDRVPGSSENRLEYNIDPFIRMRSFELERYVKNRGYFEQDGKRIAIIEFSSGEFGPGKTTTIYYINVADTSIVYIFKGFNKQRKDKLPGSLKAWQDNRNYSIEISFSPLNENKINRQIDFILEKEAFRLNQKNLPPRSFSKTTLFNVIPDSSDINQAVKEYKLNETMTESKQQINFNARYALSKKTSFFNSEAQKLLFKPYNPAFWAQYSLIKPDSSEQKQIQSWENNNRFYSDNYQIPSNEIYAIDSLVEKMNANIVPVENVYLEFDRPDYLTGDTIWFSAFVLDNLFIDSTSISRFLYVDLINAENKLERRLKLLIKNGRACGDFALNKELKSGIFRIRAYTQWMRNFQSDYLFEKDIPVYQSDINNLIAVNPLINKCKEGDSVSLYLQVLLPPKYKALEKQLNVHVRLNDSMSINKNFIFKDEFHGLLGFLIPDSISCSFADLKLRLSDTAFISEQRLSLPLKSGIDIQFFPESGKMIAGINSVIAYKAVDNKGNPAEFNADIVDNDQNVVTHISGNNSGIGKFNFTPRINQKYKAVLTLSGNKFVFNLPVTEPEGYVLNFNPDSSMVEIKNNQCLEESMHYMLISGRGAVYTAVELQLDTQTIRIRLPFKTYPKGIVQITLLDNIFLLLAERLVFNNRHDQNMLIQVETDKKEYRQREKVNLKINVTDAAGNPASSSLSMAVIDASKSDSLAGSSDIESYLYLFSELKGKIDNKLINLADTTLSGNRNIDMLMMTQGWRNYLWNSIRFNNSLKEVYPNERRFYISGKILDENNKIPEKDYWLYLFDVKSGLREVGDLVGIKMDSVKMSNSGSFIFKFPLFYDTHFLLVQNKNEKGKVDDIRFRLDTIAVPGINFRNNELPYSSNKPGYLKAIAEKFAESDTIKEQNIKSYLLPEFTVTKKIRRNYTADITVDLNKKDPTGKKYSSLMQMIMQEFGEKAFSDQRGRPVSPVLVMNGVPYENGPLYGWVRNRPVNEISNVEFYKAGSDYSLAFEPILEGMVIKFRPVISFTAYSNWYRGAPEGMVVIPYLGIYQAREFYKPNYELNNSKKPDNRTTIYWNPEVNTDSTGKASVSFYNSDLKGKAHIRISGVSYFLGDASTTVSQYESK